MPVLVFFYKTFLRSQGGVDVQCWCESVSVCTCVWSVNKWVYESVSVDV